ncbi:MAG: ABC transporter ATP-binding protein [Candidatus Ventricola sp.]
MDNNILLSVRDLTVEYTSEGEVIHAVNHISFDLEKGKTIGLVGETGAGKTSIARAILRTLPEPPARVTSGEIWFEGKNLLTLREEEMQRIRGKEISMIFQDPMTALNPIMRIGEQIAEVIRLHERCSKGESVKKAKQMLEMVGIPGERYAEYPHQFSGGMKQRVVIAMALACSPTLLLADEPTTALDVTIQAQVLDMIRELRRKLDTSMMMITHDLGIVAEVCDTVAVVYAGEVVEYGTREQIFDNPLYPYTIGLFGSLPDLKNDATRLSPIAGLPPNPAQLPEGCSFHPRCPYADEECRRGHLPLCDMGGGHLCRCCHPDAAKAGRRVKEV